MYALAWAPDGARLALGTKNGDIQVWNTRSKILLLTADQRFGEVYALAWSPDGKELAEGNNVGIGQVWDTTAHTLVAAFSNFTGQGRVGQGCLAIDKRHKVKTLASPVGVVLGLVPATHPAATFIFKVLIALKGRNALILMMAEFGERMPASRILVNTPGTQGGMGLVTGLQPSMTLGCGTFGGTSTTDNVTYTHLLNLKRVAWNTREPVLRRLKERVTTFFSLS